MARCHTCNKYLGLGLFSHWTKLDRRSFCTTCGEEYFERRRVAVLEEIYKDEAPVVVFMINGVWTANPDNPNGRERLIGHAAFTDKGVCFIHIGEHLAADPGMGSAFGLIGAAIAEYKASKERKRALEQVRELTGQTKDVSEQMELAKQVIFYPLGQLRRVKFGANGFTLMHGKRRVKFGFQGGRKAFQQFKEHALSYAGDVARGLKPLPLAQPGPPDGA